MKITKLRILNFLGITTLNVTKMGKTNRITGANGSGKSSVLLAIQEALKSSGVDPNLIHLDADKAEIAVELDSRILVERKLTSKSNDVKVVVDGQPIQKPQTWLNKLIGPFNFNPVVFYQSRPADRKKMLLEAMPGRVTAAQMREIVGPTVFELTGADRLDYSAHPLDILESIMRNLYERRAEVNAVVLRLEKSIIQSKQEIPPTFDAKKWEGFDSAAAMKKLQKINEDNAVLAKEKGQLQYMRREATRLVDHAAKLRAELADTNEKIEKMRIEGKALAARVENKDQTDTADLQQQLSEYDQNRRLAMKLEEIENRTRELEREKATAVRLDDDYSNIRNNGPVAVLKITGQALPEISFEGDRIIRRGVDLDKLSTSEQLLFAIDLARLLAGDLKVICIDRFECLDSVARETFARLAEKDGFEYFITQVADGPLAMDSAGTLVEGSTSAAPSTAEVDTEAGF
jgi:energy-coupling factor transporter ATP-binding protein EcfA2